MPIERLAGIGDIDPGSWDDLLTDDNPFLRHAFLFALEESGSASIATGWQPQHLLYRDKQGNISAAMPLYVKTHSYGEFVFDWAWADAYQRAELAYYPKLLCAVPFSPIRGARILGTQPAAMMAAARSLSVEAGYSSLHVLFTKGSNEAFLASEGLLLRTDCQFHWENHDYSNFDQFLASMRSERRRKIRRERKEIRAAGFKFSWLTGHEMDSGLIEIIYDLLAITYRVRGRLPYLKISFFKLLVKLMPDNIRILLVNLNHQVVACAFYLQSQNCLYGRYWGSNSHYPLLHFETCYYQGIDYCLGQNLRYFDPGTQGEHKLLRGFEPREVHSWHWIRNTAMSNAIADYLQRERKLVTNYIEQCRHCLPFKRKEE